MTMFHSRRIAALALAAIAATGVSTAARAQAKPAPTSTGTDRLFLAFVQDATVVPAQWWEGQIEFVNIDPFNVIYARLVAALQPARNFEVGGRVGVGDSSGSGGGFGATDL